MMELTKERLTQIVRAIDSEAYDEVEIMGWFNSDDIMAVARQLLSWLEQEPIGYRSRGFEWAKGWTYFIDSSPSDFDRQHLEIELLYAAPQLPQPAVVPQELNTRTANDVMNEHLSWKDYGDAEVFCIAWNACRAAMLQGAEPVQGWIPCSERMPEEIGRYWCYVEEQNSLGKSHYQWNCSWNGDRWWVESENGGRVTHWMPLQEPPKQTAES